MPQWLLRGGAFTVLGLLLLYAYQPLLLGGVEPGSPAGFVDTDFECLAEVGSSLRPGPQAGLAGRVADLFDVAALGGHPLAALSLSVSTALWSDRGSWVGRAPLLLRIENLLLLLAAAVLLRAFLRRVLWPWTGSEQAGAAATAAAVLFALHPLHIGTVAAVASRGDLIAMALASFAGAAFLRGRQEREFTLTVSAGVLTLLAGLASDLALALPLVLGFSELFCARRYRPWHVRLRTTTTTVIVFGLFVSIDPLLRWWQSGELAAPRALRGLAGLDGWRDVGHALVLGIEKLGVLVLPVNAAGLGAAGFALAGVGILFALQPALLAARSAPRLWGGFLLAWAVMLLLAELPELDVRIHSSDLSRARVLFPAVAVMCVGLGVCVSAVSGWRRSLSTPLLAVCFALLAHGNARPFAEAARGVETLRSDLMAARELHGGGARILVLNPPGPVRGIDALGSALPWMLAPAFSGADPGAPAAWVRGLTPEAFKALAREPEFDSMRARGLVVLARRSVLEAGASDRREALLFEQPRPTTGRLGPFYSTFPNVDLETASTRVARAQVEQGTDTSRPPRIGWKARGLPARDGSVAQDGEHSGVWLTTDAEPVAIFDMNDSLTWLFGSRVKKMWPVGGWPNIVESEVIPVMPGFDAAVTPRVDDADWFFERPAHALVTTASQSLTGRVEWRLTLLGPGLAGAARVRGRGSRPVRAGLPRPGRGGAGLVAFGRRTGGLEPGLPRGRSDAGNHRRAAQAEARPLTRVQWPPRCRPNPPASSRPSPTRVPSGSTRYASSAPSSRACAR